MVCDVCKQQQATVHLTEIVNDQTAELHLCETCANQKGAQMETHFGLSDLLAGLADVSKGSVEVEEEAVSKACPTCGMTYNDFRKVGRLGCADCYTTFKRSLAGLMKRIHGSPRHIGKSPARLVKPSKAKQELADLKQRLEQAIEMEEFESAAHLRDQIREIERQEHHTKNKKTPP